MLERDLKAQLVKRCKELGIYHRKFESPGHNGVPDWILIHNGRVQFVELKKPRQMPTALQKLEHIEIYKAGGNVFVTDTFAGLDYIIDYLVRE